MTAGQSGFEGPPPQTDIGPLTITVIGSAVGAEIQVQSTVDGDRLEFPGDTLLRELLRAYATGGGVPPVVRLSIAELNERIEATQGLRPYTFFGGAVEVNPGAHRIYLHGELLRTPEKQYGLIAFLGKKPGIAYTRQAISKAVWGCDELYTNRGLDALVCRVRRKLGAAAILTRKHYGYQAAP